MIYSLVPRHFVGGTLCAGIGLLVISAYYLRAWRNLQDRAKVIASYAPKVQVSVEKQPWPELRYLQWGVSASVLFFMLAGAADTENDWLFRLTGFLMGFCAALSFAMFGLGFVCLWNLWKELAWQLRRAKVGSLLLSIPRAALWLALGLGVMLLAGMLVDKIEKLPLYWQSLLRGLLYVPMWALIAIAFYSLWKGRSYAALMLRVILMVSFSAIIIAAAAFAYWWFISQTALPLVLFLSAIGTLNVVFYSLWVRLAALKDNMDSRISLAGAFPKALLDWLSRARAGATNALQPKTSRDVFPHLVEVIPSKLKVRVFLHDVSYEGETIPCWSYVTCGLVSKRQKEIIFTLRREIGQKPEDYPREFFELFEMILHLAEKGQLLDVGDSTLFNEAGFLRDKDLRGIGYVESQGLLGVETGDGPLLAAILLKGDEAQIAWDLGLTRVSALIGMKYRCYPCPVWSDLKREPVVSLHDMDKSFLGKITRIGIRGSYYEENGTIFLRIHPSRRKLIQEFVSQLPLDQPIALRTQPDPRANACLVWHPSQESTMAITPPGSNGSRKTGAFLVFVPEQSTNEVRSTEDGFFFFLTNRDWQKIREALISGSDVFIPPGEKDRASISIDWQKATGYFSPVSCETYFAEGWTTYQPEGTSPELNQRLAVSSSRVVLLTSEREIAARTTAEDLGDYINTIQDGVDAFFARRGQRTKRELTIQLALRQEGPEFRFVAVPSLGSEMNRDLQNQLEKVAAPKVRGPVTLEIILTIWGIAQ